MIAAPLHAQLGGVASAPAVPLLPLVERAVAFQQQRAWQSETARTWAAEDTAVLSNADGAKRRTFYRTIRKWDTAVEPYTEYHKGEDVWIHFTGPTVGHNGAHSLRFAEVDEDPEKTNLEFEHYDLTAEEPGWQPPREVTAAATKPHVRNLAVTHLEPGNGTIDYIKYTPDPWSPYHRPTMAATFVDKNFGNPSNTYEVYWMLLPTASPKPREHLSMDDIYSRADVVLSTMATTATAHLTWEGHVGIIGPGHVLTEEERDVADWGVYTYDVDVIERDAGGNFVDWHSYKWPSGLSIGEHSVSAVNNVNDSGSTFRYTYTVNDVENENPEYYPNAKDPNDLKMVIIDGEMEEKNTITLEWHEYGETYAGIASESDEEYPVFNFWRTVYIGQENCWIADRRDHQPSRMLAINAGFKEIYAAIKITPVIKDGNKWKLAPKPLRLDSHVVEGAGDSYLIIVHGFGDPKYSSFKSMAEHFVKPANGRGAYTSGLPIMVSPEYFEKACRGGVFFLTYPTCDKRIDSYPEEVAEALAQRLNVFTRDRESRQKVDMICHSQGGMITQMSILLNGADDYVRNFVSLGSPLNGLPINFTLPDDRQYVLQIGAFKGAGRRELFGFHSGRAVFSNLHHTSTNQTSFINFGGSNPAFYVTQFYPPLKQWLESKYGGSDMYDGLIGKITAMADRNVADRFPWVVNYNHDEIKETVSVFNIIDGLLKVRGQGGD